MTIQTAEQTELLTLNNVKITFGGLVAVSNLSITLRKGEILSLIGPNGSGKTTVLNLITGFYKPDMGSIRLGGTEIAGRKPHVIASLGISRTFQNIRLFNSLSVLENVMIGRHCRLGGSTAVDLFGLKSKRRVEKAAVDKSLEYLKVFDMIGYSATAARNLPYGIKRQVEIVRALATEPKVMLLDEPTAGMNADEIKSLSRLILKLRQEGLSLLVVEHNMRVVMSLSDRVTVLDGGQKIAEGFPDEVKRDPRVVEAYLGKEDM